MDNSKYMISGGEPNGDYYTDFMRFCGSTVGLTAESRLYT